jgi:O-Antigen ligase
VLVEGDGQGFLPSEQTFYHTVFKGLAVPDLLIFVLVAGVLLESARRREALAGAGPLTYALGLLTLALVAGIVTGHYAGTGARPLVQTGVRLLHIILLPVAVAELLRRRPALLQGVLVALLALVALKSVVGIGLAESGSQPVVEGQAVTYLEPTMNWLALTAVFVVVALAFERGRVRWWYLAVLPLATAELVLSYRRSFWIAAVIGLAIVLVLGSRRARLFMALGLAALGLAGYVAISGAGGTATSSGPIVERAVSLQPSRLAANAEDRYRLDERRNVLAEIRRHPITGLGIGVPWRARDPLPLEHESGRLYVHIATLYYWLNLGVLGLLAYAALYLTSVFMAWRVWRRAREPLHRALALGLLGSLVGLVVAETTGSFTGIDYRFAIVEPIALGVLAALWNALPRRAPGAG